jgi:hypothetical protein
MRAHLVVAIAVLGCCGATSARAEQLLATWHATVAITDASGALVRVPEETRAVLADCADGQLPPVDPTALALVYDTTADALEVVRTRDGTVVCVPYRFAAGLTVGAAARGRVRQALVVDGGDGQVIGSAVGPVGETAAGERRGGWKAKISVGRRDAESGAAEIVEGVFRTGTRFVPEVAGE